MLWSSKSQADGNPTYMYTSLLIFLEMKTNAEGVDIQILLHILHSSRLTGPSTYMHLQIRESLLRNKNVCLFLAGQMPIFLF